MSDSGDKTTFILDLDVAEFTEKGLQAKGVIESIGKSEGITELLENLTKAAPLFAAAGVAALAFKSAIDWTVEGEEIKRINEQFEILAAKAGLGASTLREGLNEAGKGLIDTTDLLKISNEALVKLGSGAEKLPDILNLAIKATQIYGGTAKQNFEEITNAIANGNVRMLKHYGIIVDATKAEKDFAEANGTTADQLSQTGKQQAILNAAIEKGNAAFEGVNVNTKSATSILQTLKTTFTDIGETFTLVFEKTIGPGIRSFLGGVQAMATKLKLTMVSELGEGSEQAAAKLSLTKDKVAAIEAELRKLIAIKGTAMDFVPGDTISRITVLTASLEKYKATLTNLQTKNKEIAAEDAKHDDAKIAALHKNTAESLVDAEKKKQNAVKFEKELEKIDQQYWTERQRNIRSLSELDNLVDQTIRANKQKHFQALAAIEANTFLSTKQKKALEVAENNRFQQQMIHQDEDAMKTRIKLLQNYAHNSKNVFEGIEGSWRANTLKMQKDQADMQKRGDEMWNSLSSNATSAFTTMGEQMAKGKDVASSTADAMKGFFLGFLGDRAIAEGTVMMLSGIWPPNPLALGGGAALIALGGALKSVAGSSAAPSTAVGSPSIQAAASGAAAPLVPVTSASDTTNSTPSSTTATANMPQQQQVQRVVTVNIAGNYLETDSTKRMLMDLMRQESDATGFVYNQIGA